MWEGAGGSKRSISSPFTLSLCLSIKREEISIAIENICIWLAETEASRDRDEGRQRMCVLFHPMVHTPACGSMKPSLGLLLVWPVPNCLSRCWLLRQELAGSWNPRVEVELTPKPLGWRWGHPIQFFTNNCMSSLAWIPFFCQQNNFE